MKMAIQRKANVKIVNQKEAVLDLIRRVLAAELGSVDGSVRTLRELEKDADELGLPLTGDEWGERLQIKKKGGGMHFDDDARATAASAFARATVLHSAVTWHEQLAGRASAIRSAVGAFRTKGGTGASMSKGKVIGRLTELGQQLSKTIADIFGDPAFKHTVSEMRRLGVPEALDADAAAARTSALQLAELGHEIAISELAGFRAEKKLTQKFRAPQTLAVMLVADQLLRDVDSASRPSAAVPAALLAELAEGIEEVRPLVGSGEEEDDELDDEI